ncbi:type 4 pilus major pilin [Serratia sp. IR-2025]
MSSLVKPSQLVHRGSMTIQETGIVLVLVLLVIIGVVMAGSSLFSRNDASTEYTNASELLTNSRAMLKTAGIYNFGTADAMTGALIQFGGAPGNMTVVGTKSSGTAKLQNTWGGNVTVQPVSTAGGQKTSFSLTYTSVPQEACVALGTKISVMPNIGITQINGTSTNGVISANAIGTQCTADKGSVGQNTLTFTSNT